MSSEFQMKPVRLEPTFIEKQKIKTDPAFREISISLLGKMQEMMKDPNQLSISCCIEGCCVSWCCIQVV